VRGDIRDFSFQLQSEHSGASATCFVFREYFSAASSDSSPVLWFTESSSKEVSSRRIPMLKSVSRLLAQSSGEVSAEKRALEALRAEAESAAARASAALASAHAQLASAEADAATARASLASLRERLEVSERNTAEARDQLLAERRDRRREDFHPIYGKLLHDFGYKKVFATEPKKLVNKAVVPVWEKQRIFRPERARQIADAKRADARFGLPGVITIFDLDAPDKRGIVDGQHRVGSLEVMLREGTWEDDKHVLTEVYACGDDDVPVNDLFAEINQSQPVAEMDLPGAAGLEREGERDAINGVSEKLAEQFAEMFKPSLRCRPPHLNVDNFRQELWDSENARKLLQEAVASGDGEEKVEEKLMNWLMEKNEELAQRSEDEWLTAPSARVKSGKTLRTALTKARKNSFFLGLDNGWN